MYTVPVLLAVSSANGAPIAILECPMATARPKVSLGSESDATTLISPVPSKL